MPLEVPQVSKMNFFAYDTNADATTTTICLRPITAKGVYYCLLASLLNR